MDTMDTGTDVPSEFITHTLNLADAAGQPYDKEIVGRVLGAETPITVYVTPDGRVILHHEGDVDTDAKMLEASAPDDLSEWQDWVSPDLYTVARNAFAAEGSIPGAGPLMTDD